MNRTLYGKLAAALLGLLAVTGALFIAISWWTTQRYIEEVNQKLHVDVAHHLVKEVILIEDGEVNREGLKHIFHMMMVINPGIEIYLLDTAGRILAFSAPPGRVKAKHVPLESIHRFLGEHRPSFPIMGDDPRSPGRERAFSAARVGPPSEPQGYLYVVLGGEEYSSVVTALSGSHILRLGVTALAGSFVLASLVGLMAFRMLTRRLRRLRRAMDAFEKADFAEPVELEGFVRESGDEIDDLSTTFDKMSVEMTRQLERARSADILRRQLVANVSHDLRTPLASLTAYLETLLLKDRELSEEERRRYVESAHHHSQALEELVAKLFELAKLEARETEPKPEAFAIGELVQDVAQKFELRAQAEGVVIKTDLPRDLPFVYADLRLVERVLDNLLDNALRHTHKNGEVVISLIPDGTGVAIEVADTGEGIPAEDLPMIFDRFYRAKSSDQDSDRGSGLGLAIAQRIAELHGSRIEVRSQLGEGTQFRMMLDQHRQVSGAA